jgi:hypothetical protein
LTVTVLRTWFSDCASRLADASAHCVQRVHAATLAACQQDKATTEFLPSIHVPAIWRDSRAIQGEIGVAGE